MSRDHSKQRRNDHHSLKSLPNEVLLKARSTLASLGGALKNRHDNHEKGKSKQDKKNDKKNHERLKISRSEPEFGEIRRKHRSRIEESATHVYGATKQRPMSVGGSKHYDKDVVDFRCGSFPRDTSPLQKNVGSSEEVCVQSRLYIPVTERLNNQDVQVLDACERPRKKLSFREPEIVISSDRGIATLGRSNKHMGVNSLSRRPNRASYKNEKFGSSLEGLDLELESQAMRIVRTVGQAFEVCHKMQVTSPGEPAPSTSSAVDDAVPSCSDAAASKEAVMECGVSVEEEPVGAAAMPKIENGDKDIKEEPVRPTHLDLLPPPPKKEGKRTRSIPTPSINLPDLPECITAAEVAPEPTADASTPLSSQHQLQLLRERLDQQSHQTRAAVAQLLLLRDQLAAEQAARCEAQARTHQLLEHNKELLEHIAALVAHLQDRERGSRPISAHQLTLLPQMPVDLAAFTGTLSCNNELIDLLTPNNNQMANHSQPNNNEPRSPSAVVPSFGDMSNEQIQEYLIDRFEEMGGFPSQSKPVAKPSFNANQQFYQNCQAFPNIPPLVSHYSNADLQSLLNNGQAQAMSVGHSNSSLFAPDCPTSPDSSNDSSDSSSEEGNSFIKPLSHKGTLTATGVDGRVRLIVPVSPSESVSEVGEVAGATGAAAAAAPSPNTLTVAPAAPILRTTSEKVPHRSELMAAMRQQWTRHTTK